MIDEQEIERILEHSGYCTPVDCASCFKCDDYYFAERLVNAGIGDKKQAVKEAFEKLKEKYGMPSIDGVDGFVDADFKDIDALFTELYGEIE